MGVAKEDQRDPCGVGQIGVRLLGPSEQKTACRGEVVCGQRDEQLCLPRSGFPVFLIEHLAVTTHIRGGAVALDRGTL